MKKQLAMLLIAGIAAGFGQVSLASSHKMITNYADLVAALKQGDHVRAIIEFHRCASSTNGSAAPVTESTGGINFSSFFEHPYNENGQSGRVVATADNLLVHHEKYGTVYNRLQLRIKDNGAVEFTGEILDPKTYSQMHETSYTCWISNGQDNNAVKLYNLS